MTSGKRDILENRSISPPLPYTEPPLASPPVPEKLLPMELELEVPLWGCPLKLTDPLPDEPAAGPELA